MSGTRSTNEDRGRTLRFWWWIARVRSQCPPRSLASAVVLAFIATLIVCRISASLSPAEFSLLNKWFALRPAHLEGDCGYGRRDRISTAHRRLHDPLRHLNILGHTGLGCHDHRDADRTLQLRLVARGDRRIAGRSW